MEQEYLKYLSETKDERLVPIMEKYFNDILGIEDVGMEALDLGYLSYKLFVKEQSLNELLGD